MIAHVPLQLLHNWHTCALLPTGCGTVLLASIMWSQAACPKTSDAIRASHPWRISRPLLPIKRPGTCSCLEVCFFLAKNALHCLSFCRYLLNLDGHTAAYRLGHLLATNSLVLKQESAQVEYYYRSVVHS